MTRPIGSSWVGLIRLDRSLPFGSGHELIRPLMLGFCFRANFPSAGLAVAVLVDGRKVGITASVASYAPVVAAAVSRGEEAGVAAAAWADSGEASAAASVGGYGTGLLPQSATVKKQASPVLAELVTVSERAPLPDSPVAEQTLLPQSAVAKEEI